MNDQKTRAVLIVASTMSFSLMLGATMRLFADLSADINGVRLEAAHNLAEHVHPNVLTWESLLSVVGLCMGSLASMLVFVHRAQSSRMDRHERMQDERMDRHGSDLRSLRESHASLSGTVSTLVGRIDEDREWMHRELSGWKKALEDTKEHTRALVEFTQRLKEAS